MQMATRLMQIIHYAPNEVIEGLITSEDSNTRVAQPCLYTCPNCEMQIRFQWKHFYFASQNSRLNGSHQPLFDQHMPYGMDSVGFIDFYCPKCQFPTRIVFTIAPFHRSSYHYDIQVVLVGREEVSE